MIKEENILTVRSVIGDKVYNPEGEELGCVRDMLIDPETGKIAYGVLTFRGCSDGGDVKKFAVPYEAFVLNEEKDCFTLNVDKEMLEKAKSQDTYQGNKYYVY
ncbi:PRC-barrel domain-containing protein [Cytophagaceae bacterium ABcell3]|nr:PRC-barrel domain-containing protein [Cytophagaceae bacterium ABcell3]